MGKYIIRLDDACEKRDIYAWNKMECLLDKYGIKPLVGVIPHCEDKMMDCYEKDLFFWKKVNIWVEKGWDIAMHGYNHVYQTKCGGINPVNYRSEFAGLDYQEQSEKIKHGWRIMCDHKINVDTFFAPSHTFDEKTLKALKENTSIRIISDTPTNDSYEKDGFYYVPQQSGKVRKLPFKIVTFCYHPNTMTDSDFETLEKFIVENKRKFIEFKKAVKSRKISYYDKMLCRLYYLKHKKR